LSGRKFERTLSIDLDRFNLTEGEFAYSRAQGDRLLLHHVDLDRFLSRVVVAERAAYVGR
jgi:hypothetical protein